MRLTDRRTDDLLSLDRILQRGKNDKVLNIQYELSVKL